MEVRDIYIKENGCVVKKRGENFLVTKDGNKLLDIPYSKVNRIFLIGSQSITPQAVEFTLDKEKDILFLNKYGQFRGIIKSNNRKNVYIRLAQYEIWRDKEKRIDFAKNILKAKINNQIKFLKKFQKCAFNKETIFNKIENCKTINELLGIEGEASREYFDNFDDIILGSLKFEKRSRRPPKNEVNALLSLTYSLTKNLILLQLEIEGLDTYIGYLHSIKYGRESLALDLLEEFRSVCDHVVIKWINRNEFKKKDFIEKENGIFLTESSFKKYLEKYNKDLKNKLQNYIKDQVLLLKKALIENKEYKGINVKL